MKNIIRAEYHGKLKPLLSADHIDRSIEHWKNTLNLLKSQELIFTAGMFRYEEHLFLYIEWIGDQIPEYVDTLLPDPYDLLLSWPGMFANSKWAHMNPVFWTGEPKSLEDWNRKIKPDKQCGRIALLYPDKINSYLSSHLALVKEGLLVGDRYQFISILDNVLFSYFETPRDLELGNIRNSSEKSSVIEEWKAVDPDSHFMRFMKEQTENFVIIDTVFAIS